MQDALSWEIEEVGETLKVTLKGDVTESIDFAPLLERPEKNMVFDLEGIRQFTSPGVRLWVHFINDLTKDRRVVLERCSVAVVQQLYMIANMRGDAKIRSIMLPYFCASCEADETKLLDLESGTPEIKTELPCEKCEGEMEFDDLPESYLSFHND